MLEFTKEEKIIIRKQFFPASATDLDMQYCMSVAKNLGLNPILHEIYFIERAVYVNGGYITKVVPMLGKNSYLTIAHRSGQFGGLKSWNDIEEVPKNVNGIWRKVPDLIAVAEVRRKDTPDVFRVKVNYSEYVQIKRDGTPNSFWRDKPLTMLEKVAVSQALRIAFNINGVYDEFDTNEITLSSSNTPTPSSANDLLKEALVRKEEDEANEAENTNTKPEEKKECEENIVEI